MRPFATRKKTICILFFSTLNWIELDCMVLLCWQSQRVFYITFNFFCKSHESHHRVLGILLKLFFIMDWIIMLWWCCYCSCFFWKRETSLSKNVHLGCYKKMHDYNMRMNGCWFPHNSKRLKWATKTLEK